MADVPRFLLYTMLTRKKENDRKNATFCARNVLKPEACANHPSRFSHPLFFLFILFFFLQRVKNHDWYEYGRPETAGACLNEWMTRIGSQFASPLSVRIFVYARSGRNIWLFLNDLLLSLRFNSLHFPIRTRFHCCNLCRCPLPLFPPPFRSERRHFFHFSHCFAYFQQISSPPPSLSIESIPLQSHVITIERVCVFGIIWRHSQKFSISPFCRPK